MASDNGHPQRKFLAARVEANRPSASALFRAGFRALWTRSGLGATTHVDASPIAARDFRIGEARDQHAPIERDNLAIARAACRVLAGADVVLAVGSALEAELGRLRLVGEMHDHAAARSTADVVRLLALPTRRGLGTRAIFVLMVCGKAPASDQILRRN